MIGRAKALTIVDKAVTISGADQTEAVLAVEDLSLTRFAESIIHQNLSRVEATLTLRAVVGKKVGTSSTDDLSDDGLRRVVEDAITVARYQADNKDFVSLPEPGEVSGVDNFAKATADLSAEERAQAVAVIVDRCKEEGFKAAGAYTKDISELAVANSLGVRVYDANTSAYLRTVVMNGPASGYADFFDLDANMIDAAAIAREACEKCRMAQGAVDLAPGKYEVVFEPYAVADMIRFLGYLGFNALSVQEERSFMAGRFGERITGERVTIRDDAYDLRTLAVPFDTEGVPKQSVDLIVNGKASGVVYDSFTAHKEGKQSTGHAFNSRWGRGAMPRNMVMSGGKSSLEEMIGAIEKGILVTRFHYTHCTDPMRVVMTGMTRDGTFYIENGRIKHPVKNLRIEESVLEAFNGIEMLSSELKLQRDWWDTFVSALPAIKVNSCNFSGSTEF